MLILLIPNLQKVNIVCEQKKKQSVLLDTLRCYTWIDPLRSTKLIRSLRLVGTAILVKTRYGRSNRTKDNYGNYHYHGTKAPSSLEWMDAPILKFQIYILRLYIEKVGCLYVTKMCDVLCDVFSSRK